MKLKYTSLAILSLIFGMSALAQQNETSDTERLERLILERDNLDRNELETILDPTAAPADQTLLEPTVDTSGQGETTETLQPSVQEWPRGYISDEYYVPVRSLPDINGRVIHNGLKSGTPLMVLEINENWARIRTDFGQEGWIEQHFISDIPIARALLIEEQASGEALQQKLAKERAVTAELRSELTTLNAKIVALESDNSELSIQANKPQTNVNPLVADKQVQSLVEEKLLLTQENDVLKARLSQVEQDERHRSFIFGALAVFMGAVLTALIPKIRGRKRLSGWQ